MIKSFKRMRNLKLKKLVVKEEKIGKHNAL